MPHPTTPAAGSGLITIPTPGQPWPGRPADLHAGVVQAPSGAAWALLLPTDVPSLPDQPWGTDRERIPGADSVFDGHANTLAMAAAGNPLALAVRALPGDCYLPSPLEALLLFSALRDRIGPKWVWTSRQHSASYAWGCYFNDGYQTNHHQSYDGSAVVVRRLILQSFSASTEVL